MALLPYAIKQPSIPISSNTSIAAGAAGTISNPDVRALLLPGDYVVFITTTQPDTLSLGSINLTMVRQLRASNGGFIFIGQNTTNANIYVNGATFVYSASRTNPTSITWFVVRDASGYGIATTNQVNSSTVTAGTAYTLTADAPGRPTDSMSLVVCPVVGTKAGVAAANRWPALGTIQATPASLVSYLSSNYVNSADNSTTIFTGVIASVGESVVLGSIISPTIAITETSDTATYGAVFISFAASTVTLDDNTFKLDNSPLLNNPNNTFPLYDVENVEGLSEFNTTNSSDPVDGSDGSYVFAKYLTGKTIVLEGTIHSAVPFDEAVIDNLKAASAPTGFLKTFLYKPGSQPPRSIYAYSLGLKAGMTKDRNYGRAPFQLQLQTEDAISVDAATKVVFIANSASTGTLVNVGGNTPSYPTFYFNITNSDIANLAVRSFYGDSLNKSTIAFGRPGGKPLTVATGLVPTVSITPKAGMTPGAYKLDFKRRKLTHILTDIDWSSTITTRQWWALTQQSGNFVRCGGSYSPNSFTDSVTMAYADSWV